MLGTRNPSPASAALYRTATHSSSPSLLSRMSDSQCASRSLAPAQQNPRPFSWQDGRQQGDPQPMAQPLAQPVTQPLAHLAARPGLSQASTRTIRSQRPVDWNSYLDDSQVRDQSDAAGMLNSQASAHGNAFSMFDQMGEPQQDDRYSVGMLQPHRKSPMDAQLQALIPGPSDEHSSRLLQQQQYTDDKLPSGPQVSSFGPDISRQKAGRGVSVKPIDLTGHVAEPGLSKAVHGIGANSLPGTEAGPDKENSRQAAQKAPVRKALFASHCHDGSLPCKRSARQILSQADCLPPASTHANDILSGFEFSLPESDAQAAEPQMPEKPAAPAASQKSVDFSSVFDFL